MIELRKLTHNIRFYILTISITLAIAIYIWAISTIQIEISQAIKLDQLYALLAISYLYVTMLISPATQLFPKIPYRVFIIKARRALGVSAFLFALLHGYFAFFGELGGFNGLGFLDNKYLLAISLSFVALLIMTVMAGTSFDTVVNKLTFRKWKRIHRFVYLAGILILIHVLLLGSDFASFTNTIPEILFAALTILFLLEMIRFDKYIRQKYLFLPQFGVGFTVITIIITAALLYMYLPSGGGSISPLNVHAVHIQLAKQSQQGQLNSGLNFNTLSSIPGFNGDRTKRYTVSFFAPDNVQPNQDTTLKFKVYDASTGNPVTFFYSVYTKPMHMIVVDSTLSYFNHIHPTLQDGMFVITTQFPQAGYYHIYIEFQPAGGIEQQMGFSLPVGMKTGEKIQFSTQSVDTQLTKTFGDYDVTINTHGTLSAQAMSIGNNTISFTLKDAKTKAPITDLKPYLAAFGHLTLVNEKTYEYLHVHPTNLTAPPPDAKGGPTVDFVPLGLYGPIHPGIYRVFAQFNPGGQLMLADFTINIQN